MACAIYCEGHRVYALGVIRGYSGFAYLVCTDSNSAVELLQANYTELEHLGKTVVVRVHIGLEGNAKADEAVNGPNLLSSLPRSDHLMLKMQ